MIVDSFGCPVCPTGTYFVVARPRPQSSGAMMFVNTYHPGATDVSLAQSIDVTPASTTTAINIQLQQAPTVTVSGLVCSIGGPAIGGAIVSFMTAGFSSASVGAVNHPVQRHIPGHRSDRHVQGCGVDTCGRARGRECQHVELWR